jgi:4-alpha-glucanotransferase
VRASVIPVFSIRTKDSLGIGEFLDVKKMADWAKLAGLSLIQVPFSRTPPLLVRAGHYILIYFFGLFSLFFLLQMLPVNDTSIHGTWWDSYPYRYHLAFHISYHLFF